MRETLYLRVSRERVESMTKNMPVLKRGEIPVKLILEVKPEAFREPVIEREVIVEDWRNDIDIQDIDLDQSTITQAEAEMVKKARLDRMVEVLGKNGYEVTRVEDDAEN